MGIQTQALLLWETHYRLQAEVLASYRRAFYDDFKLDFRFKGIVGARGVGKSTFLINFIRESFPEKETAIYFSADHLIFAEIRLYDLITYLVNNYPVKLICIDEIHKYKNWNQELKNIYDSFPKLQVLFSGSSSIDLIQGKYDLSRRVILEAMPGLSFREFLEVKTTQKFPNFSLEEIFNGSEELVQTGNTPQLLGYFKEYLKAGYYTSCIEIQNAETYLKTLMGIIEKTIYQDIASFYSVKSQNLSAFLKLLYFISTSQPGTININKLAKSLQKDHSTISEYLQILSDTSMLNLISSDKFGHALIRKAEKMFLNNTNIMYAIGNETGKLPEAGTVRETFVVNQIKAAGGNIFYSQTGDFQIDDFIIEVGGQSKTNYQIKGKSKAFLVKDDILYHQGNTLPLWSFGFLY